MVPFWNNVRFGGRTPELHSEKKVADNVRIEKKVSNALRIRASRSRQFHLSLILVNNNESL